VTWKKEEDEDENHAYWAGSWQSERWARCPLVGAELLREGEYCGSLDLISTVESWCDGLR
jgi:hypothetical protein